MTEAVQVALIVTVPPTLLALLTLRQVKVVHKIMNSRLDELVNLTRKDAHAEGVKEEKAKHKTK